MMTTDPAAANSAKSSRTFRVALLVVAVAVGAAAAMVGLCCKPDPVSKPGQVSATPLPAAADGGVASQPSAKADEFWGALPDPLVTVQGQKVMRDEVRGQLPARADQLLTEQPGGEALLYAAVQAAERLVDERLAVAHLPQGEWQALQTRVGLERDSEVRRHGGLQPWGEELARRLQTPAGWTTLARTRAALDMALEATDSQQVIDDAVLQTRYAKRKSRWQVPAQFHWREIALSVESGDSAAGEKARQTLQTVLERLAKGEDFAMLATELAGGHSRNRGGDRGWTRAEELDPALAKALGELAVGQRSGLVVSAFGMHIVEVLERKPEAVRTFEEAREQLRGEFLGELRFSQRRQLLTALRTKAEIRWGSPQLAELATQAAPARPAEPAAPITPTANPPEPAQAPGHP